MRAPWRLVALAGAMLLAQLWLAAPAHAQIWVVTEPDGSQRFTTTPEPGARVYMRTRVVRPAGGSGAGDSPYADAIEAAASESGLDAALIRAVIATESAFNARAVSPKGALGLMQLMPDTAAELGVADVWNPADNIRGGASHLARLYGKYRDVSLALAAYNAGEGAVERYGGIPPYEETETYVQRVLSSYRQFRINPPSNTTFK